MLVGFTPRRRLDDVRARSLVCIRLSARIPPNTIWLTSLVYPQGLKHSVADRPLSRSQHVFDQQPVYSTQRDQTFQRTRYPPRAQHKWRRERPGLQSSDNMRRNSSVLRHIARWDWERPYDQSTRRVRQEHPTATQTGEHASKRVR